MDQRAKLIPNSYKNKARNIDIKYHNTVPGQIGPLEQRLRGFGDILRLVVGQYGEISQDLHDLLKQLASAKAKHISLHEGRIVCF